MVFQNQLWFFLLALLADLLWSAQWVGPCSSLSPRGVVGGGFLRCDGLGRDHISGELPLTVNVMSLPQVLWVI